MTVPEIHPDRSLVRSPVVIAGTVVAFLFIAIQLFCSPRIGLADNGDFKKVMQPAGIRPIAAPYGERYWNYFNARYILSFPEGRSVSSEAVFVYTARAIARFFHPARSIFDIEYLGATHLIVFCGALGCLLSGLGSLGLRSSVIAALALIVFLTDSSYTSAFQSFYMQTASLLGFLLAAASVALIVSRPGRPLLLAFYTTACVVFCTSKTQEAAAGVVLALLAIPLARRAVPRTRLAAALAAVAILASSAARFKVAAIDRGAALYDIVFSEIIPRSPDPAGDLRILGGDPTLLRCSGTNAFNVPTCYGEEGAVRRVSFSGLARLYATRPSRALDLVVRGASSIFVTPNLGQFERSSGRAPKSQSRFWTSWSRLREVATRGWRLPFAVALAGALVFASCAGWSRASPAERCARQAIAALVAITMLDFLVCVLGDAHFELARHLYLVDAGLDLMVVAAIVWLVDMLTGRSGTRVNSFRLQVSRVSKPRQKSGDTDTDTDTSPP